jgi:hypothetical protein
MHRQIGPNESINQSISVSEEDAMSERGLTCQIVCTVRIDIHSNECSLSVSTIDSLTGLSPNTLGVRKWIPLQFNSNELLEGSLICFGYDKYLFTANYSILLSRTSCSLPSPRCFVLCNAISILFDLI